MVVVVVMVHGSKAVVVVNMLWYMVVVGVLEVDM